MNWQDTALQFGCKVEKDVLLSTLTSFRVGGPADYVVTASAEVVIPVWQALRRENVPALLLGNGSNLLAGDGGFRGVVLRLAAGESPISLQDDQLCCQAGALLKSVCLFARDHGLSGIETLYGIPGTVGGAVYMNAGAYGGEIKDSLVSVTVATEDGEMRELSAEEAALSYRHSRFMTSGEVILSAVLRLKPDEPTAIRARMEEYQSRRREKQPLEYPSAGSFFKRPEGHFAGALIDQCGLRGFSVGGAQISEKHAGFVINRGGATCRDILTLSDEVGRLVWEKTGVRLEREVRVVGDLE